MGLYNTLYIIVIERFFSSDVFCLKTLAYLIKIISSCCVGGKFTLTWDIPQLGEKRWCTWSHLDQHVRTSTPTVEGCRP